MWCEAASLSAALGQQVQPELRDALGAGPEAVRGVGSGGRVTPKKSPQNRRTVITFRAASRKREATLTDKPSSITWGSDARQNARQV
jgi:hypothetical protein